MAGELGIPQQDDWEEEGGGQVGEIRGKGLGVGGARMAAKALPVLCCTGDWG